MTKERLFLMGLMCNKIAYAKASMKSFPLMLTYPQKLYRFLREQLDILRVVLKLCHLQMAVCRELFYLEFKPT